MLENGKKKMIKFHLFILDTSILVGMKCFTSETLNRWILISIVYNILKTSIIIFSWSKLNLLGHIVLECRKEAIFSKIWNNLKYDSGSILKETHLATYIIYNFNYW